MELRRKNCRGCPKEGKICVRCERGGPLQPSRPQEKKAQVQKPDKLAKEKTLKIDVGQVKNFLGQKRYSNRETRQILFFCDFFNSLEGVSLERRTRESLAATIGEIKKISIKPEFLIQRNIKAIISSLEKKNWEDFCSSVFEGMDSNKALLIQR